MKIGMIIVCFLPSAAYGGPATVAAQQAKELSRRGHDVMILTTDILDPMDNERCNEYEEDVHGYTVLRFPAIVVTKSFASIFSWSLQTWLKNHAKEFDVFHIHYARGFIPWMQTGLLLRLKNRVILQPHGMLDKEAGIRKCLDALITKKHLTKANQVLVLQNYENQIINQIQMHTKTSIIPNGIEMSFDIPEWVEKNDKEFKILFLGRLHPRKRVLTFIKACYMLLEAFPNMLIRIVGPDGGDEEKAKLYIQEHGYVDRFLFVGPVTHDEVLKELSMATIFVQSTSQENFSLAVLEALAVGVPTVVTDTTHNLESLIEFNAVEVSKGDESSLALAIEKLLRDPQLRLLRSRNGKKTIKQRLSIEKVVDLLEKEYLRSTV